MFVCWSFSSFSGIEWTTQPHGPEFFTATDCYVDPQPTQTRCVNRLRKACDRHGLKLALYFSEGEWRWPNTPDGKRLDNNGGYNPEMKKAQLKELLTQYGPNAQGKLREIDIQTHTEVGRLIRTQAPAPSQN
jgi:alpha-L-fucosidase